MARIRWAGPAGSDLVRIEDYYSGIDPDFAISAIDAALDAAEFLLERPRAGHALNDGSLRKWRVPNTPLILIYRIEPEGILIARVQHNRSDWQTLL
jgi:plasmid stabilization system protein ParE